MRLRLGSPCTRAGSNDCAPGFRRTDNGPCGGSRPGHGDAHQRLDCRTDNRIRAYGHDRRLLFACSISQSVGGVHGCAFRSPSSSDGNGHVWSCCGRHPNVRASADNCPCAHDRTRDASSGSADRRARSGCCNRDPGASADRSAAYRSSNTAPIAHSRAADIHVGAAQVHA